LIASAEGTAEQPITIVGTRYAVFRTKDASGDYGLSIQGDYLKVQGITVAHGSKGIVMDGSIGTVIENVEVYDIGSEAVHFRANSRDGVLRNSYIHDTGKTSEQYGEGVYVGSANSNWSTTYVKASTGETISYGQDGDGQDRSDNVLVEGNRIENTTAEGADLKEGTNSGTLRNNVFVNDGLSGKNSADSAVDAKGNNWVIENNTVIVNSDTWTDGNGITYPSVFIDAFQTHRVYGVAYGNSNVFKGNSFEGTAGGYLVRITPEQGTKPTFGNLVYCDQNSGGMALGVTNVACVS
jgi:hypothetical protein